MKHKCETNAIIAQLIEANSTHLAPRERHLLRESLHSLVRLAKSELMMEIRSNAQKLTGVVAQPRRQRVANNGDAASPLQQHFEFNQFD